MADFDDKIKDGIDNARNGMGNWKEDAEDKVSKMRENEDDTS